MNEAADLGAALASVAWADEIVVVDSHSTDQTVAIARRHTDHVVVREWLGHIEQKNYAASLASHDWILSLDADERVTPELAAEIRGAERPEPRRRRVPHSAGDVAPRPMGANDRLVSRPSGSALRSAPGPVDRPVRPRSADQADGSAGQLGGELQHYAYRDIADHLDTINRYTTLAARQMHEDGRRAGLLQLAGHPPLAFLRNYLAHGGIRDGVPGFIISAMNAYYVFLKFAKLRGWIVGLRVQGAGRTQAPEPEP